jgi:hypothetical protein
MTYIITSRGLLGFDPVDYDLNIHHRENLNSGLLHLIKPCSNETQQSIATFIVIKPGIVVVCVSEGVEENIWT